MGEPDTYQGWLARAEATPFPPTHWRHIAAYRHEEVCDGYTSFRRDDPAPGPNHSTSFRWGWQNAMRDRQREDDGLDRLRHEYLSETRSLAAAGKAEGGDGG